MKQRHFCSHKKVAFFFFNPDWVFLCVFFSCFLLTTFCKHVDLGKYGASYKIQDIGERVREVFSSQCDHSSTTGNLQRHQVQHKSIVWRSNWLWFICCTVQVWKQKQKHIFLQALSGGSSVGNVSNCFAKHQMKRRRSHPPPPQRST